MPSTQPSKQSTLQLNLDYALDTTELDTRIITNDSPLIDSFLDKWLETPFFSLDIETKGNTKKDALNPFRGSIRVIQIYLGGNKILVIDLDKPYPSKFLDVLKLTLESNSYHPIGHDIKFDLSFIRKQFGFYCTEPRCTYVMSINLWAGIKWVGGQRFSYSLASIASRLLGIKVDKQLQTSDWSQPNLSNAQINYAANDVVITYQCFFKLCAHLRSYDKMPDILGNPCKSSLIDIVVTECNCIPAFVEMSLTGQPVNIQKAISLLSDYEHALTDLYKPVKDILMLDFSSQPQKLINAIKEVFGIELTSYTGKDSSSSEVLFEAYCGTQNEVLLRLSLARSLKKLIDALKSLINSALEYDGYAKGCYSSLGSKGSGRSTCRSGGKNSSLIALNLQNLPNSLSHPLLDKYNLEPIRSVITNNVEKGMGIIDLSASHLRYAASNSKDNQLVEILNLKDPHSLVTSQMFSISGKPRSVQYCIDNKSTDKEVSYYRSIAKVALYTQFNEGQAYTFKASLNKGFIDVSLEDCEKAKDSLQSAFPRYTAYAKKLVWSALKTTRVIEGSEFTQFRTHDGRLFHTEVRERKNKRGKSYKSIKAGEVTSCQLISIEALCMKKSLTEIYDFYISNSHLPIKLNSFTHDDISFEDLTPDKVFTKFVYQTVSKNFEDSLEVPCGMDSNSNSAYKELLISHYGEK